MKHTPSFGHGKPPSRWITAAWLVVSLVLSSSSVVAQSASDGGVPELDEDAGAPQLDQPAARVLEESTEKSTIVVKVQGDTKAQRQMRSAEAVIVIDTELARRRSADMASCLRVSKA